MSSKRVYKRMIPPRKLHGGIYDVPGYPCKNCCHMEKCRDISCDEFQRFWRGFMRRIRDNMGVAQPEPSDKDELAAVMEEEP